MKKLFACLLAVLTVFSITATCFAADLNNTSSPRILDFAYVMSEEETDSLKNQALNLTALYGVDFPICITDGLEGLDIDEYSSNLYEEYDFGCGDSRDGIMLTVDLDSSTFLTTGYGSCEDFILNDSEELDNEIINLFSSCDTYYDVFSGYYEAAAACVASMQAEDTSSNPGLPSWYPSDSGSFIRSHNSPSDPRVVDNAGLFSSSEAEELESLIRELTDKYDMDLVIFTDTSSHGYSRGVYAADFYFYNGYGFGDDYDGLVFFICMEEGNRGWYTAACSKSRDYLTEGNLNSLDDSIEPEMRSGDFFDAAKTYISQIGRLYEGGVGGTLSSATSSGFFDEYLPNIFFGFFAGIVVAFIVRAKLRKKMKNVAVAKQADSYVGPDGLQLRKSRDFYLFSTYVRTRRQQNNGGGGGGSSFSGGFSSHGGGSFSGGGRSF